VNILLLSRSASTKDGAVDASVLPAWCLTIFPGRGRFDGTLREDDRRPDFLAGEVFAESHTYRMARLTSTENPTQALERLVLITYFGEATVLWARRQIRTAVWLRGSSITKNESQYDGHEDGVH